MPSRQGKSARSSRNCLAALALATATSAALAAFACASTRSEPPPVALFASTTESGQAFAAIRDDWIEVRARGRVDAGAASRGDLGPRLEAFIAKYPTDGITPFARVLLAFVYMDDPKDYPRANATLELLKSVPPGTIHDLVDTARARWLRLHGNPDEALHLIEGNVGKNVDPIARALFQEELVEVSLASSRSLEAITYMDTWIRQAGEEDRDTARMRVREKVDTLDTETLKTAFQNIRAGRARFGYSADILRIIAEKLATVARKEHDGALARMLLDPDAGAVDLGGDAGIELEELALSRTGLNVVEGRTIGLLLPTELAALRDEAAAVLRGAMWALGLPHGIRRVLASGSTIDRDAGGASAVVAKGRADAGPICPVPIPDDGMPEEEPQDGDKIALAIRDDAGDPDRIESSLAELAGQGASVIIAALDPHTAERARAWSRKADVPVILLSAPAATDRNGHVSAEPPSSFPFAFVLGEAREHAFRALTEAVPELDSSRQAEVVALVDESESLDPKDLADRYAHLAITTPVSCDTVVTRAGDPRFPVGDWESKKRRAWVVTGSPACARDLVEELSSRSRTGTVVLSLEAASELPSAHRPAGLRVVSLSAGVLPLLPSALARDPELRKFADAFGGKLDWWTAIGRDAATLARKAVAGLPTGDVVSDPARVAERRQMVRSALARERVRLWTSERRGFEGGGVMGRSICVMDVAER